MLTELHVESVGIFEDATIECGPGLTVVTGETGAGKTLLVESLGALLGRRVDAHLIGPQAESARIDGRFQVGEHECVLSRVVTAGRSKAYVDLRPATVQGLSECAHGLMSLTSQGEIATGFTDESLRSALSRIDPEIASLETEYAACWGQRRKVEQRIAESGGNEREIAQMLDLYQFQLSELQEAELEDPDEYTSLDARIDALRQSDDIRHAIERAVETLRAGAGDGIVQSIMALQKFEFFRTQVDRLSGLQAEIDDLVIELRDAGDNITDDAAQLDLATQRQHQLKGLMRKYGEDLAAVIEYREALHTRIDGLTSSSQDREALHAELEAVVVELRRLASLLSDRRRSVGADLSRRIEQHLHALHMETAQVEIRVQPVELHSSGADRIEMWLSANRGSALKPLEVIASGGERSRILLGMQLEVLPEVETVIFDEIDAGIGGATGHSIGQHLAQLAKTRQVLCVTHLPQVAAFADAHVVIRKTDDGARVRAELTLLTTRDERTHELARMLAGMEGSQNAQEHAHELLDRAAEKKSA